MCVLCVAATPYALQSHPSITKCKPPMEQLTSNHVAPVHGSPLELPVTLGTGVNVPNPFGPTAGALKATYDGVEWMIESCGATITHKIHSVLAGLVRVSICLRFLGACRLGFLPRPWGSRRVWRRFGFCRGRCRGGTRRRLRHRLQRRDRDKGWWWWSGSSRSPGPPPGLRCRVGLRGLLLLL